MGWMRGRREGSSARRSGGRTFLAAFHLFSLLCHVPIATLDPISNNGIRNIPKNSCHVNGEVFEDGDQVIMTRADLNGEIDPCESCLCVRGEVFCWWGGCPPRHTSPPSTLRPLIGNPSSPLPPASVTTMPSEEAAPGRIPDHPTLSSPYPPIPGDDSTSAKSSSVDTSTPEYPEEEENEERSSRDDEKPLGGESKKSGYFPSLTTKPNSASGGHGKGGEEDFEGDMGVEGVDKGLPEGTSELADTVSESGDIEKQSRQQQSPSMDMFDVDAF